MLLTESMCLFISFKKSTSTSYVENETNPFSSAEGEPVIRVKLKLGLERREKRPLQLNLDHNVLRRASNYRPVISLYQMKEDKSYHI